MTDRKYLKTMIYLSEELERAASAEPYDPDQYNKVIDSINSTNRVWLNSLRRRSWFAIASIIFISLMLAWIVYSILY